MKDCENQNKGRCSLHSLIVWGTRDFDTTMDIINAQNDNEKRLIVPMNFRSFPAYEKEKDEKSMKGSSNDISIVYWDNPIDMKEWVISPICLPESGIINNGLEYGMISGWGFTDLNGSDPVFLPMGWVQMLPIANNETDENGGLVLAKWTPYPKGTVICEVSSSDLPCLLAHSACII